MSDVLMTIRDGVADLSIAAGDLEPDETLRTAVLISLFSDARADLEDRIPDGGTHLRGWWADQLLPSDALRFGSRLWLLSREKLTDPVLATAEEYARDALAWIVDEDIAEEVAATATRLDGATMLITVTLTRGTARELPEVWEAFRGLDLETGPTRVKVVAA